ncbi:RidA family protein [Cognatishimia maritima]|uniref:Enamine deaminase RidA, house cleaning of reactive enamine intermediates, YjgF/YER057c/UK114 family n=1 Tax=Cognatishimia maritima TaxID=870908 RepID=A0A1M5UPN6_9RHOB|nr:RidA family protein [Cognatishimia maritima]SHH64808.1 Enamine deaminase RidA, house cleaning of reactive enamine intermediates, YjgF/YER057c/UK114 family [Cognatishimia maritima]
MTITRIEPDTRMSQIVIHKDMIYLAGQIGEGPDVTAQTTSMLAEVDRLLAEAGSSKSNILQAQIWLSDIGTVGEMNAVWDAWIDPENPPARACVESRLVAPEFLVEVMIVATKD